MQKISILTNDVPLARLDREIARCVPAAAALSRSRIASLIREGALKAEDGQGEWADPGMKVPGRQSFTLYVPSAQNDTVMAENIPLDIRYEDTDLLVLFKPAGMVVHPAPGSQFGTLVAALMHHCGDNLSGLGGAMRPGIVHRIDKDTSGLMVVAKSDAAHQGLAEQFAAHSIARRYRAFCCGVPDPGNPQLMRHDALSLEAGNVLVVRGAIGRHPNDRKRMAMVASGGKHAVTRATVVRALNGAAELSCELETGRTHQIRVHMAHIGHPLIGDPLYLRGRKGPPHAAGFQRQALHAEHLGFIHPLTGAWQAFDAEMPEDMSALMKTLEAE